MYVRRYGQRIWTTRPYSPVARAQPNQAYPTPMSFRTLSIRSFMGSGYPTSTTYQFNLVTHGKGSSPERGWDRIGLSVPGSAYPESGDHPTAERREDKCHAGVHDHGRHSRPRNAIQAVEELQKKKLLETYICRQPFSGYCCSSWSTSQATEPEGKQRQQPREHFRMLERWLHRTPILKEIRSLLLLELISQ